jgi:uridine phosphorylase
VLPETSLATWTPSSGPVVGSNVWLDRLVRVYLVARDYLVTFDRARGRRFDRGQWVAALLGKFPAEEYLCQLAALNHASNSDELTDVYQQRFLEVIAPTAAQALRRALVGADGLQRRFLARQTVLRSIRLVLVPPAPPDAGPDPALAADLVGIDPESAAVLLAHLAADSLIQERQPGEPRFCGTTERLAMEMIANNLFNDRDDNGDLLGRYRLLWMHYGRRLTHFPPRRPPAEMLREATGISFDELTTLGFAYWAHIQACRPSDQVRLNAMRIRIIDAFTDRPFAGNPAGVCLLDTGTWPGEAWMRRVAAELSHETAFARPIPDSADADWALRWFTPAAESNVCGHATLATAHAPHTDRAMPLTVRFASNFGLLTARTRPDGTITLDFPAAFPAEAPAPDGLAQTLGAAPHATYRTGAPAAATVLEELIALGAREFISIGAAGCLQPRCGFGEAVVCTGAIRDEGVSHHYAAAEKFAWPSETLTRRLAQTPAASGTAPQSGLTWTIDAPYRETVAEARSYQAEGVVYVEMEAAALFTVGRYRGVDVAAAFVISDHLLAEERWTHAFGTSTLRQASIRLFDAALHTLSGQESATR